MIDPELVLEDLRWKFLRLRDRKCPFKMTKELASYGHMLMRFGVPAQIAVEKDSFGSWFTPHPNLGCASPKSWALVLAVRSYACLSDDFWRLHQCGDLDDGDIARRHAFHGSIIDLVAVSLDLNRVYGRLNGVTAVLGYPQDVSGGEKPVRLYGSVKKWVEAFCDGVTMIGDEAENLMWLRDCEAGIICDDVTSGDKLMKKLRRPYVGPAVLVAA